MPNSPEMPQLPRSRYLIFIQEGARTIVSFERCLEENQILRYRASELRHAVRKQMKRLGLLDAPPRSARMAIRALPAGKGEHFKIIQDLECRLDAIAKRPLSPNLVEALLGISSQERLRWTKDGRLPTSGRATLRKGAVISIATHPADKILALAADPSIIAGWRNADAQASTSPR